MQHEKWKRHIYSLAVLGLCACSADGQEDLRLWIQERKAQSSQTPARPYEQLTVAFAAQPYLAAQDINPFSRRKLHSSEEAPYKPSALLPDMGSRPKDVLENYALDAMVMVGSMQKHGHALALVRVDQQIFPVKVGDYLGHNHGRVVQVQEETLSLQEIMQEADGTWTPKITHMSLQARSQ